MPSADHAADCFCLPAMAKFGVMAENKTKPAHINVADFVARVESDLRRADAGILLETFARLTGMKPCLWGDSLIGYGQYHYKYASGREGDYFLTGFSPRKTAMTIYIMPGFNSYTSHLARLGAHKHSRSCLYIKKLEQIDLVVLEEIISDSVARMKEIYQWKQ